LSITPENEGGDGKGSERRETERESEREITISIFRVERLWAGESFEIVI
jgi:hypothetical protein